MKIKSKTLIKYQILDINNLVSNNDDNIEKIIHQLSEQIYNIPVEIRGQAPLFFIIKLFLTLRNIATEITYRPSQNDKAYLVYSILDEGEYLRPADILDTSLWWDEKQLVKFDKQQTTDQRKKIKIDLTQTWQQAKGKQIEDKLKDYLKMLYKISPFKKEVKIKGKAPIIISLLTINWFMPNSQALFYEQERLK